MRVEANISLKKKKAKELGTKVEIKNLNSFRSVERGIDYEIKRQEKVLNDGRKVVQETRGWDDLKGETFSQREKEKAHDYRYFPEPDLLPLIHSKEFIEEIRLDVPELPQNRRTRFKKEYGLSEKDAEVLISNRDLGEYFEKVVSELPPSLSEAELTKLIKTAHNYLTSDLLGLLKGKIFTEEGLLITPENFSEFITLVQNGQISSRMAKEILAIMFKTGADPSQIIEDEGMIQITDESEIESIVKEVMEQNPKAVEDFNKGKGSALQFMVGQVMTKTKGKASPQAVGMVLGKLLTKI